MQEEPSVSVQVQRQEKTDVPAQSSPAGRCFPYTQQLNLLFLGAFQGFSHNWKGNLLYSVYPSDINLIQKLPHRHTQNNV